MTNDLTRPEPLVPAEVSMGNNDWFPLHFRRMRKSRWWRVSSDFARSRSIDLWGYAYEEQPAGSLPNDDVELADFAGFGRDVAAWMKAKDEIMAAWVLCSDGRYYHPTLCEIVLQTWEATAIFRGRESKRLKVLSGEWDSLRREVFARDDYTCRYCGERGGKLECDHVLPVAQGGETEAGNLVTSCLSCNRRKGARTPEQWKGAA